MASESRRLEESLENGLALRAVRDERDVERFVALNEAITGESAICTRLMRHRPETSYDDFLLVEDKRSGEVVSTTCLIPWHCRYEDVELDVAQLEMVVTSPPYRHRGLVRAQVKRFHQMLGERCFDLSVIGGIPYYYRQYGYAYAIDSGSYDSLPSWRIPDPHGNRASVLRLLSPTAADAPTLGRLYRRSVEQLQLYASRSVDYWRYLLERAHYPVRLVQDVRDDSVVGYICTRPLPAGRGIAVTESVIASHNAGMVVLQQLREDSSGEIQLGWPQSGTLVKLGRSLGSTPVPNYQWLVRITDVGRFLSKIAPVLERRVAASECAGLASELCINLFRQAFTLRFEAGKLAGVDAVGFVDESLGADGGDLCIPPEAFVRLVLGYRELDELRDAWPDIWVRSSCRRVFDVLFPKMASYFLMVC